MRESTDRVESALHSPNRHEFVVANRILENPAVWQQWENEHAGLMRQVAGGGFVRTQAAVLKQAAFRLIHRKALFEYLRDHAVRGEVRRRIFASFHPTYGYARAVVAEHGMYLRKACSFLCTSHVGSELVRDTDFDGPMQRYEALYAEYFEIYCDSFFLAPGAEEDADGQRALLPLLKSELDTSRAAIMNPGPALARLEREAQMRNAAGDTQRLRTLVVPPQGRAPQGQPLAGR
jgi:hypothetical protein